MQLFVKVVFFVVVVWLWLEVFVKGVLIGLVIQGEDVLIGLVIYCEFGFLSLLKGNIVEIEYFIKVYLVCGCGEDFVVVDDVFLVILWGEIVVIVGELGLGKIMMVWMLLKVIELMSGLICYEGKDIFLFI